MSIKPAEKRFVVEAHMFDYNRKINSDMYDLHFHNTYEIYYLSEGNRRYLVDHSIYEISAGDLVLIPPRVVHRTVNSPLSSENDYSERYLLAPREEHIPGNLKHVFNKHHYTLSEEDSRFVLDVMKKVQLETEHYDEYYFQMYKNYLNSILILLARKYFSSTNDNNSEASTKRIEAVIREIVNYIYENINTDFSLSDIADKFGYSKEYLSIEFKKVVGSSYIEFLNTTRIAMSAKMLVTTSYPIKKIAIDCGFKDSNYFAAVFRKRMNISPSEYRELVLNKQNDNS